METDPKKVAHLEQLRGALTSMGLLVELVSINTKPYLKVANADTPRLNERVLCEQADDESWCFWWPWRQPIGAVDDMTGVTGRIASVLRSVEGASDESSVTP